MDEEKFLGEPSNSSNGNNNIRSLQENQLKQTNSNSSNPTKMDQRPSSSTSSHKQNPADDSFSGDGDDVGWWDCSLCTYKNSADKFKCEICDLRRGTSTRKPRCNADTIVAQVVKQQEQIRQQTRVRTPKVRSSTAATSSNDLLNRTKSQLKTSSSSKGIRTREDGHEEDDDEEDDDETDEDSDADSVSSPKPKKKRTKGPSQASKKNGVKKTMTAKKNRTNPIIDNDNHNNDGDLENDYDVYEDETGSSSDESSCTDVTGSSRVNSPAPSEFSEKQTGSSSSSSYSDSPEPAAVSPVPSSKVSENPFKITSLEVNGNLIKYSPPTSSGRTGLIIDKKRFTQHSVTVNDVTITFTEFATRQNRYVRKKKKRRDGNGGGGGGGGGSSSGNKSKSNNSNGKNRPTNKSEAKSTSNNTSSAANLEDS